MSTREEEAKLHRAMLKFIFDEHALSQICFNYTWQRFKYGGFSAIAGEKSVQQLKVIFTTVIIHKFKEYGLPEDQNEYFQGLAENDFISWLEEDIEDNEPTLEEDYVNWKSLKDYRNANQIEPQRRTTQSLQQLFKKPTLDDEDVKIIIIEEDLSSLKIRNVYIDEANEDNAFRSMMLTADDKRAGRTALSSEEVVKRLRNERLYSSPYDAIDIGCKAIVKKVLNATPREEEDNCFEDLSSICASKSAFFESTLQSSIEIPSRLHFSSSSSVMTRSRSELQSQTSNINVSTNQRKRGIGLPSSASNARMGKFVKRIRERNRK
jgi:hypothetical protein